MVSEKPYHRFNGFRGRLLSALLMGPDLTTPPVGSVLCPTIANVAGCVYLLPIEKENGR